MYPLLKCYVSLSGLQCQAGAKRTLPLRTMVSSQWGAQFRWGCMGNEVWALGGSTLWGRLLLGIGCTNFAAHTLAWHDAMNPKAAFVLKEHVHRYVKPARTTLHGGCWAAATQENTAPQYVARSERLRSASDSWGASTLDGPCWAEAGARHVGCAPCTQRAPICQGCSPWLPLRRCSGRHIDPRAAVSAAL